MKQSCKDSFILAELVIAWVNIRSFSALHDLLYKMSHWKPVARKLKIFEGDRDETFWVKGAYHLEKSSVLAHLFTGYGQFWYFSWFFSPFLFLSFFRPPQNFTGTSPSLKFLWGDMSPPSSPLPCIHHLLPCFHHILHASVRWSASRQHFSKQIRE